MKQKPATPQITPKDDPAYRCWVYNRIDGEMLSKIVTAVEATKLYDEGWRMSPADFSEDQQLKHSPEFQAMADDMAQVMNTLLNINKIEDRAVLVEFAEEFLQLKINKNAGVKLIKKKIKEAATAAGLYE